MDLDKKGSIGSLELVGMLEIVNSKADAKEVEKLVSITINNYWNNPQQI